MIRFIISVLKFKKRQMEMLCKYSKMDKFDLRNFELDTREDRGFYFEIYEFQKYNLPLTPKMVKWKSLFPSLVRARLNAVRIKYEIWYRNRCGKDIGL